MSLLSRLFGGGGGGGAKTPEPIEHKGYQIFPEPVNEGGKYRVAARIVKDIDGEEKVHHLIRADTLDSVDTANEVSVSKAKSMIDQMGDQIFS